MSYTLDALADDIRRELSHGSAAAKEAVCRHVSRALTDREFVAAYLKDRPAGSDPQAIGSPHDHGSSWAIYGQATGVTEMTEWKIVEKGEAEKPSLVEPVRTYLMHPGDVRFYDIGAVHSPKREAPVKLIRIEGKNLDHVKRSNIKAK